MSSRFINAVNGMPQFLRTMLWWCRMALRLGR